MSSIFYKCKYRNRVGRLLRNISDIVEGKKPVKDLRRKLKRIVHSIKEIEKDLEHYENNYEPPRVIVIEPHDGLLSWFFVIPCWGDNYEIITRDTYEEFIASDKECFLEQLHGIRRGLSYCKEDLIREGFLTEEGILA
ncbi:hypothetical protein EK521_04205 [Salmonella enterica]|nr:hypothetical protein [Salmonella enterica]EKR3273601.1 hypothetical protein [Salmonella enterica subsp. enterica serovar Typhi]HCK6633004.1 hypothetical protein [Salmonella enterica subsp. enterica serovar Typhi str. CT18]EBH7505949.1 hypothetical protein [Salmonella enterica]EDR3817883.1 hypothetical protein [Salmonella enterica]